MWKQQEQQPLKQTMSSIEHSNSAGSALPAAHSTSALPADVPNSSTESSPRSSVDTTRSSSPESDDDPANYTGLWEPFQIPYSCSLQSEVVFPGQKLPLKIRFGPQKGHHGGRHDARKERDRGKHGRRDSRHDHEEDDHVPQPETLVPHPRFVVKKGILKVVEHTLLREVSVAPVPFKLRYQNQAVLLNRSAAPQLVQGTTFAQQQQQKLQSGRIYADNGLLAIPEAGKDKDNTQIYQEKTYNWSNSHLYDMLQQEAHSQHPSDKASTNQQNPEQNGNSNSNDFKRFFFKPKRHSLDYSTQQQAQSTHTRKTSASTTVSNPHGLSPSPSGSFNTSRIINTIEAKFKAEIMAVSLTPQLQQRERRYQRRVEMILKGAGINDPGRPLADSDDEEEHDQNQDRDRDEEDEEGVWQTTVWIQLPGPAELNTSTETKHIIRKHTLQLILLCGLVGGEDVKHTMSSESLATPSSANREFRLEMDLYVTGPRVPL
ncbi:hypothetical protein BGZ54_009956 [Gamsiella multidivaricata]|nr:hypothetical protein BGZ54_009956 [Gamsiella multidivaricata]